MIKVNELRVGNWLKGCNGDLFQVEPDGLINFLYKEDDSCPEGIPLTPEILEKCGFDNPNNSWCKVDLGKWCVGEDGYNNLVLGRTGNESGLPYHPCIEQYCDQGFTIQSAAEIQKKHGGDDDVFFLKKKILAVLPPIKHLHQLQNLYYALTGEELQYTPNSEPN